MLGGCEVEIIEDVGETLNPWRNYLRCLEDLPEAGHVCILQDDVIVCRNFAETLEQIAGAKPGHPVCLFTSKGGKTKRTYNLASLRYGKSRYVGIHHLDLVHVVGMLWPVIVARELVDWIEANPLKLRGERGEFTSDDAAITRWRKFSKQEILCTVPSIVQHPDDVPSIVNSSKVAEGRDSSRTAGFWIGDADPLELDWTR